MLPLPTPEWYKRYPKPFSKAGNIDTAICQQGLRLSKEDEETLLNDISKAMTNNGVAFGDHVELKGLELKSRVKAVLHTLSSKVGPQYGWYEIDEIDTQIVPDYLFELAKKFHNNLKRRVGKKAAANQAPADRPSGVAAPSPPLETCLRTSYGSAISFSQGLNAPAASGDSTPAPTINVGQGHPLHTCDICVARVDTGEDYEDTIDVFLKPESRNSAAEPRPSDYDFALLKKQLTEALSYTEELEIISYYHAQKGEVEVDHDSKWRVALKHLSSQPSPQATLNFQLKRKAENGRPGDHPTAGLAARSSKTLSESYPDESSNPLQSHPAPTPELEIEYRPNASSNPLQSYPTPATKQKSDFAPHDPLKLPSLAQLSTQFTEPLLHDLRTRPATSVAQPPTLYEIDSSPNDLTQPLGSSVMQPLSDLPMKPRTPLLGLPASREGTICVNSPRLCNQDARVASTIQPDAGVPVEETIVRQRNPLQSQKREPPAPLLDCIPKRPKIETRSRVIVIPSDGDDSDSEPVIQQQRHRAACAGDDSDSEPVIRRQRHRVDPAEVDGDTEMADPVSSSDDSDGLYVQYSGDPLEDESQEDLEDEEQDIRDLTEDERQAMYNHAPCPPLPLPTNYPLLLISSCCLSANVLPKHSGLKLLSCPTLDQLTSELWEECCAFFKHDPRKAQRDDKFHIEGLRVGLFPHQAFAVFWVFWRRRCEVFQLFISDDMGVGKTLEFLGVWIVQRSVNVAWDEVQRCRSSPDPADRLKHLPAAQEKDGVCPTNLFPNLACPCVNGSTSYQIAQCIKQGPVLMLAPAGNVFVWEEECAKRVDTSNKRLGLEWHVAYEKSDLSPTVVKELRCDIDTLQARRGQDRHLVISSNNSFYKKVIQRALQFRNLGPKTVEGRREARHPITWSIMGRDEYHLAKGINTIPSQYFLCARTCTEQDMAQLPPLPKSRSRNQYKPQLHYDNPLQIALTGTPFEGSPDDLLGHITTPPSQRCICKDPSMETCTPGRLKTYAATYRNLVANLQDLPESDKLTAKARAYSKELNQFLSKIMIRRTGTSKFLEYPIIPLPEMNVREIASVTDPKYLESIRKCADLTERELKDEYNQRYENWVRLGKKAPQPTLYRLKAYSKNLYYLRLAADFAAIPKLHYEHPDWTFQAQEVYSLNWDNLPKDSLYYRHLNEIIDSSPKLTELREIFRKMDQRSQAARARGERKEKMILTTAHPIAMFLLGEIIKKRYPKYKVVMVTARMGQAQRNEIFNGFCNKESKLQDKLGDYDILLTTTPLVGTGYNLTEPNVFVMFDPLWMRKDQRQAFARVHRTGQEQDTHLYLLHCPGNPVERDIVLRQRKRKDLGDMTWGVTTGQVEAEQMDEERRRQRRAQKERMMNAV